MTRLQIISDAHLEFHADDGREFIASLDPTGVDVLIVAGDLSNAQGIEAALKLLCKRYAGAIVAFVLGNHELYRGHFIDTTRRIVDLEKQIPNLRVLVNRVIEASGVKIAGTTLWFPTDPLNVLFEAMLGDFGQIRKFRENVYETAAAAEDFLRREVANVDVVVTHHLPTREVLSPQYVGSELNRFFVNPVAKSLPSLPPLWVFGHTHTPGEWTIQGCRFIANPFGYPREAKSRFRDHLIVEI